MVQVTKKQAVCILIEGAIRAFESNDEVCAISLAGAAEEAMPSAEETLFVMLKVLIDLALNLFPRLFSDRSIKAGDVLNAERNWLKHYNVGEEATMDIEGSWLMLRRALSRYDAVYTEKEMTETMLTFWLRDTW